jgi:UV DNA damage endonuclease
MTTTTKRLGFCCKYMCDDEDKRQNLNFKTTTVAWLNRQTVDVAYSRLWEILRHNVSALKSVLQEISGWPNELRMFRIGSDALPMYTEPKWGSFWKQSFVQTWCAQEFAQIGAIARAADIRVSMHPGQYVCLASERDDVVTKSIEEFEYHTQIFTWMGYSDSWHPHGAKINVHIAGRNGVEGMRRAISRLSPEARNLLTLENDEFGHGLDACLEIADTVPVVLDIYHHLLRSNGEYIRPGDDRWKMVIESWKGTRPTIHFSQPKPELTVGCLPDTLPDITTILQTVKKTQLRAHSDNAWNIAMNRWALEFWDDSDIQMEYKNKNLVSWEVYRFASGIK